MEQMKYKLFWKSQSDNSKVVSLVEWNEKKQDYYAFIKSCIKEDYHQISITGEIMLGLIEMISSKQNVDISKIDLMEEDYEEDNQLLFMVEKTWTNRGDFVKVLQRLRYLEDESSIEIKRVTFTDKLNKEIVFIQVNGLVGTNNGYGKLMQDVIDCIREYINR